MKALLIASLLTASADIELLRVIEFPLTIEVNKDLAILSYFENMDISDFTNIVSKYKSYYNYFLEFEKVKCKLEPLQIRIVSRELMTSSLFFLVADPYIYGRYFEENNHMYLTPSSARKSENIAHEMAHYMYDICKIKFKNDNVEHKRIKQFENFIKEKENGR